MRLLCAMSDFSHLNEDLETAEEYRQIPAHAGKHSLAPYQTIGLGSKAALVRRVDVEASSSPCYGRDDYAVSEHCARIDTA